MKMQKMNRILCLCLGLLFCLGIFAGCGGYGHQESTQLLCDHPNTLWIVVKEATLDEEGSRHLGCMVCGQTLETEVIPEIVFTQEEITEKLSSSVVKVYCYDYDGRTIITQGSGFFIDGSGAFITNAHVVEDCHYIKIQNYLGATYDVDVMYAYNRETSDYAICRAKDCVSSPVTFTQRAAVGDRVYALGYPNDAPAMCITSGQLVSTNTVEGTEHFYVCTAEIDHGSSGGILADAKGRVLGITTGMFTDGQSAALKYADFKEDAEGSLTGGKAPSEYFSTVGNIG